MRFEMLRRAGQEDDMELVWQYVEDTVAPLIKRIYEESSSAMKLSERVQEISGDVNVWETLTKKMSTFTPREVSYVCRKMKVKGVDCICLSLNFQNGALGSPNDKTCIQQMESAIGNHVQLTPYKTRQRFLSPESDEDHFKIIKGVDVVGRTHYLRALALPEHLLPSSLKRTAEGIQVSDECEDDTPAVTINQGAEGNIETGYFDPVVVEENAGEEMELDDIFLVNAVKETETMDKQNKPSGSKKRSRRGNILDSPKDYLTEKEQNLPAKRSRKKKSK